MTPSREELLEELYTLSKKYSRVKQIVGKPYYGCAKDIGNEPCHGIYIKDDLYKELKELLED